VSEPVPAPVVGINLLWLVPGEVGGSEQSTVATVRGLLDRPRDEIEIEVIYALQSFVDAYPDVAARVPVAVPRIDGRSRVRRILTESSWLSPRTAGLDVVHHAGGTISSNPPHRGASTPVNVLTLHDLQPLVARDTHDLVKRWYLALAIPRAVNRSRRIAVPSEFVRSTVLRRFDVAPEQVVAIPHAVPVRPPATPSDEVVERYRLDGPVVLYPAITYPHKDHATLLAAFERVLVRHPGAVLVLAGGPGSSEGDVRAQIEDSATLRRQVRRTGRIPEADVAALLELADVVAVPSRYEGFGLPALEGMAAGTAVVAADATSLPEVLGDAGQLVRVGDVAAWTTAISDLLADDGERGRLGETGRARAARFTTEANAAAFAQLYRDAVEGL
jgi:alpha-1,3-rhamnosyl/mannosyltransferase